MVKISIIIPMYNVEQYLKRCVNSVYAQGLNENEFEVIIVNDGSPDNSLDVAIRLTNGKDNVKIITQENKGLGGARNTGIANAKGDYLVFLDADDWYIENTLPLLLNNIQNEDIIEFSVSVRDDFNELSTIKFPLVEIYTGIDYYFKYKSINSVCNKIYKRSFLIMHNINFQEKIYGEDFEFNSYALFFAEKVKSIEDLIIVFFQSKNSITRNNDRSLKEKYVFDYISILNDLKIGKNKYATTLLQKHFFDYRMTEKNVTIIVLFLKEALPFKLYIDVKRQLYDQNLFVLTEKLKIKKYEFIRLSIKYFPSLISAYIYSNQYFKSVK